MELNKIYKIFQNSSGVSIDTRTIKKNNIFFAIRGPNFNGNKFAMQALMKGAVYAIVDEEISIGVNSKKIIVVKDCLQTLSDLANFHRMKMNSKILAITGSNGKTTTKELINSVLSQKYNTIYTIGNLNNHIGVPLTLLRINSKTEITVLEMGASGLNEINHLCNISKPDYGYISNFGNAHLEGFGSIEGVVKGKSELYEYIFENTGTIFYNHDDKTQNMKLKAYKNKFSFGLREGNIKYTIKEHKKIIELDCNGESYKSSLYGIHNCQNIMAAILVGEYFNVSSELIKKGIKSYNPKNKRSQIIKTSNNKIFLDAYNANPSSMEAALIHFSNSNEKNKIIVIGDMFELGKDKIKYHQKIINLCKKIDCRKVFIVGKIFSKTNFPKEFISKSNVNELIDDLKSLSVKNSCILVKGSRGIELEKIVNYL